MFGIVDRVECPPWRAHGDRTTDPDPCCLAFHGGWVVDRFVVGLALLAVASAVYGFVTLVRWIVP